MEIFAGRELIIIIIAGEELGVEKIFWKFYNI
jgi:hypothetical protein